METRLDRFGRIVLPKDVRDDYALLPGDLLMVRETSEGILLTRQSRVGEEEPLRMIDGVLVFDGVASGELAGAVERERQVRSEKQSGKLLRGSGRGRRR